MIFSLIAILLIVLLLMTRSWTKDQCQQKFDKALKACHEVHNRKINQLETNFTRLTTDYETLSRQYKNSLHNAKHYQSLYDDIHRQKVKADKQMAKLQKALYCARKRRRELAERLKETLK